MAMAARTRARRTRAGATRRKTPHHPHVLVQVSWCATMHLRVSYSEYIPHTPRGRAPRAWTGASSS